MKITPFALDKLKNAALVLVGNLIYAFTVKFFLLPGNLMSSGTTGIALVVNHFTKLPITVFVLAFNVVMLLVALWLIGKKFVLTTIVTSLLYPLLLQVFDMIFGEVRFTDNILLNVLFSGIGLGTALGLVLRAGASTGGMDIPPILLKRYFGIPVSISLYVFDFIILLLQMAYHQAEDLLYGILLLLLTSLVLDKVMLFGTTKTEVKIISSKVAEIRKEILTEIDRGCTLLQAKGGYRGEDSEVILSIVSNSELPKLNRLVHRIDPDCFMVIGRVNEVHGRGFSKDKYYAE